MALNIKNTIRIAGEEQITFADLFLEQKLNAHHYFELSINWEQFNTSGEVIIEKSKEMIGEKIEVSFGNVNGDVDMTEGFFVGIITEVQPIKSRVTACSDQILVKGFSPTISMDGVATCNLYEEKSISDIVNEVMASYSAISASVNPLDTGVYPYTVQYNTSSFNFLQSLAVRKGEWFYYDGQEVFFGAGEADLIELRYGIDLDDFSLKMQSVPKKMAFTTHDYLGVKKASGSLKSGTSIGGNNSFMAEKSEAIFDQEGLINYHQHSGDGNEQAELDAALEKQNEAQAARAVVLQGTGRNTGLKLGSKVRIIHKTLEEETEYGTFIVTAVTHTCSGAQEYSNRFEALPETVVYPPYTDTSQFPRCESQRAIVTDNADPEGLGRVKVRFNWHDVVSTPWIRIAQPHSGADKGFHFIPEIEEEVMVGFEAGNAELPFMMGTLYNGNAKPESMTTDANDIKAIRTRSGHTIELNDTDGEEKINIYDNEGSIITFDTANKSLIINSAENIDISAKNINISAEENIVIGAKANIDIAAEGDLSNQAKGNVTVQSDGDTSINSGGAATIAAKTDAAMNGQNVSLEGKVKADLIGAQTTVEGKMTAIQGASGKVEVM